MSKEKKENKDLKKYIIEEEAESSEDDNSKPLENLDDNYSLNYKKFMK